MSKQIVQIYEIQTPEEACALIEMGVDHVGSVITSLKARHDPIIRETVGVVRKLGAISSVIPLYTDTEAVIDTISYYQPNIIHLCDKLDGSDDPAIDAAIALQKVVKDRFPEIKITRSIPIAEHAGAQCRSILTMAARLEPVSDYFLTDTVIDGSPHTVGGDQPVDGFVGITGLTCDWQVAARLVVHSRIPVILAGGISPENVAAGIRQVDPFGVDSCTCTNALDESGQPIRFRKDMARVKMLVEQV
ncbi:N-(5'phosphoribosyl)anthranilate isomerase [Desulfosarcina variabilis str. Montpellier]|uniref:phosphoribosylanthranilate isomerase n=1 Tax=Desulfosarcina variabilis TaxID=2300 RepID=UPI003AFA3329